MIEIRWVGVVDLWIGEGINGLCMLAMDLLYVLYLIFCILYKGVPFVQGWRLGLMVGLMVS